MTGKMEENDMGRKKQISDRSVQFVLSYYLFRATSVRYIYHEFTSSNCHCQVFSVFYKKVIKTKFFP